LGYFFETPLVTLPSILASVDFCVLLDLVKAMYR
jgi:hypothetical protein